MGLGDWPQSATAINIGYLLSTPFFVSLFLCVGRFLFSLLSAYVLIVSLVLLIALKPEKVANIYPITSSWSNETKMWCKTQLCISGNTIIAPNKRISFSNKKKNNLYKGYCAPSQIYIQKNVLILVSLVYLICLFEPWNNLLEFFPKNIHSSFQLHFENSIR